MVIVDPSTCKTCDDNQVGEIWVSGGSVAMGYWSGPKETEETFKAYLAGSDKHVVMAQLTRQAFVVIMHKIPNRVIFFLENDNVFRTKRLILGLVV